MKTIPTFKSKADAFDYMFATLCEQEIDMMDAAKKAEQFANIVAKNRSLPDAPKNLVGQCVDVVKQVSSIRKDYPEAWDIISNLASGVFGALLGANATKLDDDESLAEPIDFDNLEDVSENNDRGRL